MKSVVVWEAWRCTFSHPSGGDFGVYDRNSKEFSSVALAEAFASGLRLNNLVRDVRVESKV
jgi:hypothetical protein